MLSEQTLTATCSSIIFLSLSRQGQDDLWSLWIRVAHWSWLTRSLQSWWSRRHLGV